MIIIGADLSLTSSAISILKNNELLLYNYTNNKNNYKWIKNTDNIINYIFHTFDNDYNYSDSELYKLQIYDDITEKIINDISYNIKDEETKIYIEGYAFSANGKIIDIVTFSTLLRYKLSKIPNIKIYIISPSSLKSFIGSKVYNPDKKGIYRNDTGKASGSFDKKDMMNALLKINLNYPYIKYIEINQDEILKTKTIPKPFDDFNDSIILNYFGCVSNNINI
jgi:hypothetical protein